MVEKLLLNLKKIKVSHLVKHRTNALKVKGSDLGLTSIGSKYQKNAKIIVVSS
jgi:hypothetical protein